MQAPSARRPHSQRARYNRPMLKRTHRSDWSRCLPRPLIIPGVIKLVTLADVRALVEKHLPRQIRARPTWRYVAARLKEAADGADPADVAAALVIALALEGVKCQPK